MIKLLIILICLAAPAAAFYLFPGAAADLAIKIQRAMLGLKQQRVNSLGCNIEYLSGGEGEPLVLLHGFGADKEYWVWPFKYLRRHFRIISPDLPGFGQSGRDPEAGYTVYDQVERVHNFTQAIGLKSYHLGGNSMGGNIAGIYAARYPDEVKSLWLLAPGGVLSALPSEREELLERNENILVVDSKEGFDRLMDFCFVKQPHIPGPIKRVLIERSIADHDWHAKIFQDLFDHPASLETALKDLPVPTLILWGHQDRLLHVSGAQILKSIMPNAQAIVMPDTGHMPMMEKPKETAEHYLRFHGLV